MGLGEMLGWIGVTLALARLLPQPWHTLRSGHVSGVSATALGNNLASDLAWLAYGLVAGLPPVWILAAVSIPVDIATITLVRSRIDRRSVAIVAGWGIALVVSWLAAGIVGLAAALGVSVVVVHLPQVVTAVRGSDLSGLHRATYWLALGDAALWGGYGLLARDGALIFYGLVLSAAGIVILARLALAVRVAAPPVGAAAYTPAP